MADVLKFFVALANMPIFAKQNIRIHEKKRTNKRVARPHFSLCGG